MRKLLFIFVFTFSFTLTFSQNSKGIDPRQFVKIYELNRQTNNSQIIYSNYSIKVNTLDINSLITIQFDKDSMRNNPYYYGNVSLRAEIDQELIKVSPYSEVGEKQSEVGVK